MANLFLDFEGGNDANDGTTFANRFKTLTSGATAARIAPGDTIRIMASPDETLVGDADWTNNSNAVTLASAVTANIDTCDSAWTASSNVTATATTTRKEGTNAASLAIATAFTTGKVAFRATGTLNLSGYQQVSFWVRTSLAIAASTLSLRLCTDTIGAVSVHTVAIPAIPNTGVFVPITVNLGTNLNSAIASVALYADLDPGVATILLDNILACKAVASADSLSLTSIIGKVHNRAWAASTAYSLNDKRRPTQPNRNGFQYKVTTAGTTGSSEPTWPIQVGLTVADGSAVWTCEELEDTYYAMQSINGTAIKLDLANSNSPADAFLAKYQGATETVATYKREVIEYAVMVTSTFTNSTDNFIQDSGTLGNNITFSGGWNRTDMSTQTGETWTTGQNGNGQGMDLNSRTFLSITNFNSVRFQQGIRAQAGSGIFNITNCHHNNGNNGVIITSGMSLVTQGIVCNNNAASGLDTSGIVSNDMAIVGNGNGGSTPQYGVNYGGLRTRMNYVTAKGNGTTGCGNNSATLRPDALVANLTTANNTTNAANSGVSAYGNLTLINAVMAEATPIAAPGVNNDDYVYSQKHQGDITSNLLTTSGGTIRSVTDVRNTASGMAWRFNVTSVNRSIHSPLRLSVAKIACAANVAVNVTIWTRRDNTNIRGQLYLMGGQIGGANQDLTVACDPAINTWTQSSALTFTPTEDGVVEILFRVWDGVGTTSAYWVDDVSIT